MSDWNENVETCSDCGIEWKKIGKQCPVCFAPAEQKTKQMKTDQSELILKILDERDLSIGEIHSHGKEVTTDDLIDLNKKATNKVESLLSKQRVSLIKEFEGVIGEDETESKKDKMGFNNLWKHRNLLRIQQRRRLKAIKDTNEVAEEENK